MEYYVDIPTDQFEQIREHETTELVLPVSQAKELTGNLDYPYFKEGDGLKLYHPSEYPEALRVEILAFLQEEDQDQLSMEIRLNEWMMSFPDTGRGEDFLF